MIKKELTSMPKLKATPNMMRMAAKDIPIKMKHYPYDAEYKTNIYIRCCTKNNLLKISIFFTEYMRMGSTQPVYEIYADRDKKQYLTYNNRTEKWLTASIYRLNFPSYAFLKKVWYSREAKKVISKYFNTDSDGITALNRFQQAILTEKLDKRHKKETDPWDEDLKQTPALPKDWLNWVSGVGIPEHYIFYEYSRKKKGQTGYCSHCKKHVPIKEPRYNKQGKCPCCRTPITYKALGKCGTVYTNHYTVHLLQRCKDGVILREFDAYRMYPEKKQMIPNVSAHETRRIICDKKGYPMRAYYYGCYKQIQYRWIDGCLKSISSGNYYFYRSYAGKVYGKTLPSLLKNELKKTGFMEYYRRKGIIDPERFLRAVEAYPYLEKLAKVGLTVLVDETIKYGNWSNGGITINKTANSILDVLNVSRAQLKSMISENCNMDKLRWLQYEHSHNMTISDDTMEWVLENDFEPKSFDFIGDRMNIEQIHRYIKRKMKDENMRLHEVITTWSDYLSMAKKFKLDINQEKVYKVHRLRLRHNDLVALLNKNEISIHAAEIRENYPNVEDIMADVKDKYEFSDENYTVLVPTTVDEILFEGKQLSHCVSHDKYWDRLSRSETYIFFLRKTDEVNVPYYTLEVEPCGTIRQKRTLGDLQNDDIKDASVFLRKWQNVISKRMTGEDRRLAEISRQLRIEEFAEMDSDNIIIRTGHLHGHRLVDVLMADLMEAA